MMSMEKSSGLRHRGRGMNDGAELLPGVETPPLGELRGAILDDDDRRVRHLADRDRKSGQREQVDRLAERRERQHGEQGAKQQHAHRRDAARTFFRATAMTRMTTISS